MKTTNNLIIDGQVTTIPKSGRYDDIISASPEARGELLKFCTGTHAAGDFKKTTAKTLTASINAGDCKEQEIRDFAEKITGVDIREIFQGVYELRVVFSAIIAGSIALSEADFDTIGGSILGLLSPFIQKDELKELLPQAIELAKNGGTAAQIRDLKPKKDPKEPKAVKEMREKAEAAEKKAAEAEERVKAAEERVKAIEETYTVKCQFAVTDITLGRPVLESQQLRDRIKDDLRKAHAAKDEESLLFQKEKLLHGFYGACQLLGIDPLAEVTAFAAELAPAAKVSDKAAAQTIEVEAAA